MAQQDIKNFRENIRHLCDGERGAYRRLAKAAKISPHYLSDVVRGLKSPSLDISYDIARAAGYGLDDLALAHKKFLRIFRQKNVKIARAKVS